MLKFFRKIRQQLVAENKFSKYLLYAIGEVVLVVIGILIALYINNQNELKLNENKIVSNLKQIHSELAQNIKVIDGNLINFKKTDSLIYLIMHNKLDSIDFKNTNRYLDPASYYYSIDIDDKGYQKLILNTNDSKLNYDTLISSLRKLSIEDKKYIDYSNDLMAKTVNDFYDWKKLNTNWFFYDYYQNRPALTDEEIKFYFSNESRYKNFVNYYYESAFGNQFPSIVTYRNNAFKIYKQLTKTLKLSDDAVDSFSIDLADKEIDNVIGTYQFDDFSVELSYQSGSIYFQFKNKKQTNQKLELFFITKQFFFVDGIGYSSFKTIEYDKKGNAIGMSFRKKDFNVSGKKVN